MNREKELFEQALDLASAEERVAFLKGACGADTVLLERVLGLLRASEGAGAFLPEAPQPSAPRRLGLPDSAPEDQQLP